MNDLAQPDTATAPSRPAKLTVDFYEQPDGVAIHNKQGGGPWVFLLLWLVGCTVGCVGLLAAVINDPSLWTFAFAIPFWASWLFVAGLLVWMIFGKETLLVRHDKALFLRTVFITLSTRAVPRSEIQGFRECRIDGTENDEHLWGIEMVTLGKPVRFAFRLPERERAWIIHQLNQFLATEGPTALHPNQPPTAAIACDSKLREPTFSEETLSSENSLAEPPTDCAWEVVDDVNAFEFRRVGRLNIAALAGLLFVNSFWNGIVSVFVLNLLGLMPGNAPQGWEWWGLFVFLIPFEAIGLTMFGALVVTLLEPLRSTGWRFEQRAIAQQIRWPVYWHTRTWDMWDLKRLELRRRRRDDRRLLESFAMATDLTATSPFSLAFVSGHNVDLCEIRNLTEGEARWIAGMIFQRRPHWSG